MIPVFVLTLDTPEGTFVSSHASEEMAKLELHAWVNEHWGAEEQGWPPYNPEDPQGMLVTYFDFCHEDFWHIHETSLQGSIEVKVWNVLTETPMYGAANYTFASEAEALHVIKKYIEAYSTVKEIEEGEVYPAMAVFNQLGLEGYNVEITMVELDIADGKPSTSPTHPDTPATADESVSNYVMDQGQVCPHCGVGHEMSGDSYDSDCGYIMQKITCGSCGASWTDIYTLSEYCDLEVPDDENPQTHIPTCSQCGTEVAHDGMTCAGCDMTATHVHGGKMPDPDVITLMQRLQNGEKLKFVFTGTAYVDGHHITRPILCDMCEEHGHYHYGDVDWHIDYVVRGDTKNWKKTNKLKKAEYYGKKVITIEQFITAFQAVGG